MEEGFYKVADYVKCRSCNGSGKKWVTLKPRRGQMWGDTKEFPCRACGGSGINRSLMSTNCKRCGTQLIYPTSSSHPPNYCSSCKVAMQAEKAAKWQEKSCPGTGLIGCSNTIRYHLDWDKIPTLCPACKERKKREIEEAKAKWKEKSCQSCGAPIKYHADWTRVPDLCKVCKERIRAKPERNTGENSRFRDACQTLGMTDNEVRRFSHDFHNSGKRIDRLGMSKEEIREEARDWLNNNRHKRC